MACWNAYLSIMQTNCEQNTMVEQSGTPQYSLLVPEFARLGFIELVDARSGIPDSIPDFLVRTIKRAKHQPIWVPGVNFPDDPMDIYEQMKPFMRNNNVVWQYFPSKRRSSWRLQAVTAIQCNRFLN